MTKRLWVRMLAKDNFTQKKFVMIENKQNRQGMAQLKKPFIFISNARKCLNTYQNIRQFAQKVGLSRNGLNLRFFTLVIP